jgi:hypothetical protein
VVWFVCYLVKIIYLIAGPIILSELRRVHSYRIENGRYERLRLVVHH